MPFYISFTCQHLSTFHVSVLHALMFVLHDASFTCLGFLFGTCKSVKGVEGFVQTRFCVWLFFSSVCYTKQIWYHSPFVSLTWLHCNTERPFVCLVWRQPNMTSYGLYYDLESWHMMPHTPAVRTPTSTHTHTHTHTNTHTHTLPSPPCSRANTGKIWAHIHTHVFEM